MSLSYPHLHVLVFSTDPVCMYRLAAYVYLASFPGPFEKMDLGTKLMFTVHYVSVQLIVISLAPQSLSLRHKKSAMYRCCCSLSVNSKVLCLLNK